TFVPMERLPAVLRPVVNLLPLTYFSRGVRALTYSGTSPWGDLAILAVLTVVVFAVAVAILPWSE
ncbi:MAG: ABC transporter permease, partial [Salinigranum sp.]